MVDAVGTLCAYLVDWPGAAAALEQQEAGAGAAASPSKSPAKSKGRKGEPGVRRLEGFERREVWHVKWAEVRAAVVRVLSSILQFRSSHPPFSSNNGLHCRVQDDPTSLAFLEKLKLAILNDSVVEVL